MDSLTWDDCQAHSDSLLSAAMAALTAAPCASLATVPEGMPGNYLISLGARPLYMGEASDLRHRLAQQFSSRSTFYGTYRQKAAALGLPDDLSITAFEVRFIGTRIGRKEVEEFGIVNLDTPLNKFQVGKRDKVVDASPAWDWEQVQRASATILSGGCHAVDHMPSTRWPDAEFPACPGLYRVAHPTDGLIYIGESSSLAERYSTHSSQTRFSALRRHVATELLGLRLRTKAELGQTTAARTDKRMYLSEDEDDRVTRYLAGCEVGALPIRFGRFELEEHLIYTRQPLLNRKSKR